MKITGLRSSIMYIGGERKSMYMLVPKEVAEYLADAPVSDLEMEAEVGKDVVVVTVKVQMV